MTLTIERIAALREWLCVKGLSENTAKAYGSDLLVFLEGVGTPTVTATELEELGLSWLQLNRNRVSAATTNRRLTSLKAWCGYAGIEGFDEYSAPRALKTMPNPLVGGMDDVIRMIETAKTPQHKALIVEMGMMGCRVHEALKLRASDYSLGNDPHVIIRGKGDKQRYVPVSARALEYLVMPIANSFVEGNRSIVEIEDRYARSLGTNLALKAGLTQHVSSHMLRATFASWVYNRTGNDIRLTQELLGHDSVTTTQLYTGVAQKAMRAAVEF
jgi:integrase/recombinase XerD